MTRSGDIDRTGPVVASLGLPPLTITIFERTGWLPITACIAARSLLHPDEPALVDLSSEGVDQMWTWRNLELEIESTAARLVDAGAKAGDRIAIACPNNAAHVIVTEGAWRLGATVVPIDPSASAEVRADFAAQLGWAVVVDAWRERAGAASPVPGVRLPDPHSILSTGGTLSAPRWAVQRGSVWGRLDGPPDRLRDGYGLGDRQRQLVTLPMWHGFGFGYAHQYGIAYGHCLVVQRSFDAEQALAAMERWRIQVVPTVPTVLGRLARAASFEETDLSSVEVVIHGAAPCPDSVRRAWMDRLGPHRVIEAFGATDVSIDCTIRGDEWLARPGSVGRPVGCQIEIRSADGSVLSTGQVGEIHVQPTDPRAAHPPLVGTASTGDRAFRPTGDIGYLDDERYLFVVGRAALRLICGGVSVHVEAVEAAIAAHPQIRDVAIFAVCDEDLGEVPHALICLEEGGTIEDEELVSWCRPRLEAAQVPRSFITVTEVPRAANGKIDRVALQATGRASLGAPR